MLQCKLIFPEFLKLFSSAPTDYVKAIKACTSGWLGLVMEETLATGWHNFQVRIPKPVHVPPGAKG